MKLGIIGCGKMGTALVGGAINSKAVAAEDVTGVGRSAGSRDQFIEATGAKASGDVSALSDCDVVLLCTKPHDLQVAMQSISEAVGDRSVLVISVAAGVTLEKLELMGSETMRVIRAMPNTPSLVGKGATGFCLGSRATGEDAKTAEHLLGAVGLVIQVPERLLDAVTGVSGSGPAYVYLMIEAMADGGVRQGLPRADAIRLAAQTVYGAASMVIETGEHPAVLKDKVTSPGGTTIAGVTALESHGVRFALIDAVAAAVQRAKELGS